MSSEKDDVKGVDVQETVKKVSDDDPSLDEAGMTMDEGEAVQPEAEASDSGDGGGDDDGPVSSSQPDSDDAGKIPEGSTTPHDEEAEEDDVEEEGHMSLLDHLGELRLRLTRAFIAVAVGMVACYGFADKLFDILMQPMIDVFQKQMAEHPLLPIGFYEDLRKVLSDLMVAQGMQHADKVDIFVNGLQKALMQVAQEGHFQYTYPAEAFFSHIKISIVAGLFLVSPYVFAQIWGFIAPGLYAHERKWMIPMAVISALFFTAGGLFGYFIVFPYGFEFFAGFASNGIQFTPKLNEYLSFCLKLLFAFGFVFELPLFIFFLARLGMVSSKTLREKRKYAILIGFVVAAILTPPDPFTQCLMAGPLIMLYELGIWVAFFFGKKEKRHLKKQAEAEAARMADLDKAATPQATSEGEEVS
ncbi:twin-arginine translocase subunit TatC [Pseudodesulfovibrio piezophilus]|uniref:Sec-independent protein translocase protein TatC n=1 Tax=Pseudodesulfovibrio piezophilus (strain DSM 21447 / JCM 15486 / C1TLV30) TaxID=1322246 RepID=M1WNM5_PSEP2|nr:twin-arginine translocase subunit TatC [Pseudodesulfovibrio piezophilus]CCH50440.1 Sec-independent protein translocase, TatC subunit [Pseudodesulfovibrio piezophilus C1TLV30]